MWDIQSMAPPGLVPESLQAIAQVTAFWSAYFFCDGADELDFDFNTCAMGLPVADGLGLRVQIDGSVEDIQLELLDASRPEPVPLGWCDYAHWHPYALRWSEVDLVARWTALQSPELRHPGLVVLLLSRFAPICADADAALAIPLLAAALRSIPALPSPLASDAVGLPDHPISTAYLEGNDFRDSGVAWRTDERLGSYPVQSEDGSAGAGIDLYSLRDPDNEAFPFAALRRLTETAGARCAGAVDRHWLDPISVVPPARRIAADGDLRGVPDLLRALQAAGCDHPTIVTAMTEPVVPAEAWWVLELLLAEPPGRLLGRWLAEPDAGRAGA
jgi:hypothetical protein